jgi:hypothetical protein
MQCELLPSLADRDEMRKVYRGPAIEASYQVSVHLAKRFQRRRFFLEINQSKTRIVWQPCLLTDHKDYSFRPDLFTNMATTGDSCF